MDTQLGRTNDMKPIKLGVLTSGGDAQGMNAAVRAVVRTALVMGAEPYGVMEGWQGAVEGGEKIRPMGWSDVSSILNEGGTVIGTARCAAFRERDGLRTAARNLVERGIDRMVVIGGDGSLAGTDEFRREWPSLLAELVERGEISSEVAAAHPALMVVGIVGSIDNDLVGADMTIGTDSALHRIVEAIDALSSTAASHQRTFVVEVMGRKCGYLPLMAMVSTGCDYVLIPENPPAPGWEEDMCIKLAAGREAGRRDSIVLVAEGAQDQEGNPITAQNVADILHDRMNVDARVTILGHVQRGGTPSAYDRWMSTLLGYAAVQEVLRLKAQDAALIVAAHRNRIATLPLVESVANTRNVAQLVKDENFAGAIAARGSGFVQMTRINEILSTPPSLDVLAPVKDSAEDGIFAGLARKAVTGKNIAIIHAGGLAPGMNTAARAAVRIGLHLGYTMLGVEGSFQGMMDERIAPLKWEDVEGWAFKGGAELGTRRPVPTVEQFYALGRSLENHKIDGLLVIGGFNAYESVYNMVKERDRYPAFNIPMVCIPASIDNNLPGSELSIGSDTALNNAVWALDRIKESAAASRRCFVAETMGRKCGYLALLAGMASGAELVYLEEEKIDLARIARDADHMKAAFEAGRELYLVVRNEEAGSHYNLEFMARVFEEEGGGLFDVRASALGHLQQGGAPSPFDRILATRMATSAINELAAQLDTGGAQSFYIGSVEGDLQARPMERMMDDVDVQHRRPKKQWWLDLQPVVGVVSDPATATAAAQLPILRSQ
ncbi:MAG: 6-phosphofructokinase [Actinomycetaceae bacterium]|nr:6-phosphofructokinase [Actinomycetaceae bacterium]